MEKTKLSREKRQEIGRLGGLTTAARYGPEHMAKIGRLGFCAYAKKYHAGNSAAARRILGLSGKQPLFYHTPIEWTVWLEDRNASRAACKPS
jgi:general stress protein YciG